MILTLYLLVGVVVALFNIRTFYKNYRDISVAEYLFSILNIGFWPILGYFVVCNYIGLQEDNPPK